MKKPYFYKQNKAKQKKKITQIKSHSLFFNAVVSLIKRGGINFSKDGTIKCLGPNGEEKTFYRKDYA